MIHDNQDIDSCVGQLRYQCQFCSAVRVICCRRLGMIAVSDNLKVISVVRNACRLTLVSYQVGKQLAEARWSLQTPLRDRLECFDTDARSINSHSHRSR